MTIDAKRHHDLLYIPAQATAVSPAVASRCLAVSLETGASRSHPEARPSVFWAASPNHAPVRCSRPTGTRVGRNGAARPGARRTREVRRGGCGCMRGPQTITAHPRRRGAPSCANPTADQDGYAARTWARRPRLCSRDIRHDPLTADGEPS